MEAELAEAEDPSASSENVPPAESLMPVAQGAAESSTRWLASRELRSNASDHRSRCIQPTGQRWQQDAKSSSGSSAVVPTAKSKRGLGRRALH